jgi:hypothetical protein
MAARAGTGGSLLDTMRTMLVALVGLSSATTAAYAGASLPVVAGASVGGLVLGVVVVAVALPAGREEPSDPRLRWED